MSCEYIQSTHRLALLCQNPKSPLRSTRSTRIRSSLQGRTLWVSPSASATSPTAVFRCIKNLEARWCLKNNVRNERDGCSLSVCCCIEPIYHSEAWNKYWFRYCISRDLHSSVSGAGMCGVSVGLTGAPHLILLFTFFVPRVASNWKKVRFEELLSRKQILWCHENNSCSQPERHFALKFFEHMPQVII